MQLHNLGFVKVVTCQWSVQLCQNIEICSMHILQGIVVLLDTMYLPKKYLISGSSMYESWSLSMFNTLFTSLPVICVGMFDKDLKPATLLAVPELYAKGRLYQAFNLKLFISWMVLATLQSVGISFLSFYVWGFTALRDNTTFALGSLVFTVLVVVINAKCTLIEMQNRQWLAWASFIISVGGWGIWNVLIMGLYRHKQPTIFLSIMAYNGAVIKAGGPHCCL